MENRKITFKEIAEMTNLSVGTVSRYFNNYSISNKAKEKIKKVVDELNYIPNFAASSVKKQNLDVYLIMPFNDQKNDNNQIINGVKSYLEQTASTLFVNISSEDSTIYLKDLKNIINRNPVGIIIFLPMNPNNELKEFVLKLKNPKTVFYNPGIKSDLTEAIYINSTGAFQELTEKIYQQTHSQKIAFLGIGDFDKTSGYQRRIGFDQAAIPNHVKHSYTIAKNKYSEAKVEVEKILLTKPDVIICATHTIALTVSKIIRNLGHKPLITDIGYGINELNLTEANWTIFIDYFLIGYELATKIFKPNLTINKEYQIIEKK